MPASFLLPLTHHLVSLSGAAAVVAIGWCMGSGYITRLRMAGLTRMEGVVLSTGLGLGVLSLATYLVGIAASYSAPSLRVVLCVSLVVGLQLRRSSGVAPASAPPPKPTLDRWGVVVLFLAAVMLLGLLPTVLTPMVDYDGLAYHVGAPKRWMEVGRIVPLPTHLHTLWPMGEEMLNGLLLATVGDGACKPLMFLFALLTAASVFCLGARLSSAPVGALAAAVLLVRAGAPSINTTSVELPLTYYVVLSVLLLALRERSTELPEKRMLLVLSAMMAGFACATKLNGLLCLAFLVAGLFAAEWTLRTPVREVITSAAIYTLVAIGCAAPWYARSWWITGNPIFPFAFGLLGGRNWDAGSGRTLALYFKTFDLPGDDLVQRAAFVKRHLVKLAVLMGIGLALPRAPRWVKGFVGGAGLFAMIQAVNSDNPRFLLPATAFAAIALAWWLAALAARWSILGWAWACWLALLIVPQAAREMVAIPPAIWGGQSREGFIDFYVNNRPAFLWANAHLPGDARVLYGPDNRTYYLQRDVYWSSAIYQREILYDSPEVFRSSVAAAGIKWLILNRDVYKDSAISFETRMRWRTDERSRLEEAATQGRLLFSALGVEIYELR